MPCDHATGRPVREDAQPNHVLGFETMALTKCFMLGFDVTCAPYMNKH